MNKITIEREALAAQLAEPVAREELQFLTDVVTAAGLLYHGKTCKALAERISEFAISKRTSLHAHTPAAVPLTDDQIDATIWKIVPLEVCMADHEWLYDFARAIERAHGIGDKS